MTHDRRDELKINRGDGFMSGSFWWFTVVHKRFTVTDTTPERETVVNELRRHDNAAGHDIKKTSGSQTQK